MAITHSSRAGERARHGRKHMAGTSTPRYRASLAHSEHVPEDLASMDGAFK
jgi:hypothetical protein